jgi:hypothetical protein
VDGRLGDSSFIKGQEDEDQVEKSEDTSLGRVGILNLRFVLFPVPRIATY